MKFKVNRAEVKGICLEGVTSTASKRTFIFFTALETLEKPIAIGCTMFVINFIFLT